MPPRMILPTDAARRILNMFVVSDRMEAYANQAENSVEKWVALLPEEQAMVRELFEILQGVSNWGEWGSSLKGE